MDRYFLVSIALVVCLAVIAGSVGVDAAAQSRRSSVRVVDRPDTSLANDFYVGNREPLTPSPFMKLPIRAIRLSSE